MEQGGSPRAAALDAWKPGGTGRLSVSGSTRGGLVRLSAYSGSEAEETQRQLRIQAGRHRGGRARGGIERRVEASAATGF